MGIRRSTTSTIKSQINYPTIGSKSYVAGMMSGGSVSNIGGLLCRTFTTLGSNSITATKDGYVDIYAWGGGGGGGYSGTGTGGSGGFAYARMFVKSGQSYIVFVGGGGDTRAAGAGPGSRSVGNGGVCGSQGYGGNGGGYSGLFVNQITHAGAKVIAAGGGGASWENCSGGAGGGTTGVSGTSGSNGSPGGGTQSAGGSGVGGAGSGGILIGGDCGGSGDGGGGGAGGSGFYGGGAGSGNANGDGGGGGSSFVTYDAAISTLTAGSGRTPANTGSPYYSGTYAYGGAAGANVGSQGLVVIVELNSIYE